MGVSVEPDGTAVRVGVFVGSGGVVQPHNKNRTRKTIVFFTIEPPRFELGINTCGFALNKSNNNALC